MLYLGTYTDTLFTCSYFHSINRLTWHDGTLPEDELWLKTGGDKGGGTFKLNVFSGNPNSPENTIVFSLFDAPDIYSNLLIAFQPYFDQISDLSTKEWR